MAVLLAWEVGGRLPVDRTGPHLVWKPRFRGAAWQPGTFLAYHGTCGATQWAVREILKEKTCCRAFLTIDDTQVVWQNTLLDDKCRECGCGTRLNQELRRNGRAVCAERLCCHFDQ